MGSLAHSDPDSSFDRRFQKMRGGLSEKEYEAEIAFVKNALNELAPHEAHWDEYLKAWA
jgi:3'-5' exonuclease